jgi:hypothetical protein
MQNDWYNAVAGAALKYHQESSFTARLLLSFMSYSERQCTLSQSLRQVVMIEGVAAAER